MQKDRTISDILTYLNHVYLYIVRLKHIYMTLNQVLQIPFNSFHADFSHNSDKKYK